MFCGYVYGDIPCEFPRSKRGVNRSCSRFKKNVNVGRGRRKKERRKTEEGRREERRKGERQIKREGRGWLDGRRKGVRYIYKKKSKKKNGLKMRKKAKKME